MILILIACSGEYRSLYEGVFYRHPEVEPVEEREEEEFSALLLSCMDRFTDYLGDRGSLCFCVDDLIFIDEVNLR
jgi:hypothetical protein